MDKKEQIEFLADAIATLTQMRQTALDLLAENEARLAEINAHIDRLSNVEPETLIRYEP